MKIDKELEMLRKQKETTIINMLEDKRLSDELKIKKLQDICGFQGGIDLIYDGNDYENCGTCDFALTNGKNCLLSIIAEKLGYVI
jgi:hypothetical protein